MSEPKLKPCPFCGSKNLIFSKLGYCEVRCLDCHAIGPVAYGATQRQREEEAANRWNRRENDEQADC